jgi:hypothetical protein
MLMKRQSYTISSKKRGSFKEVTEEIEVIVEREDTRTIEGMVAEGAEEEIEVIAGKEEETTETSHIINMMIVEIGGNRGRTVTPNCKERLKKNQRSYSREPLELGHHS